MHKIALSLLLFFSLISRASDIDSLVYGKGGGITGRVTVYKIEGKKALKGWGLGTYNFEESAKLSCGNKKKLFKAADNILKSNENKEVPGNIYYFLEIHSKGKTLKLVWNESFLGLDDKTITEIKTIQSIINSLKYAKK